MNHHSVLPVLELAPEVNRVFEGDSSRTTASSADFFKLQKAD